LTRSLLTGLRAFLGITARFGRRNFLKVHLELFFNGISQLDIKVKLQRVVRSPRTLRQRVGSPQAQNLYHLSVKDLSCGHAGQRRNEPWSYFLLPLPILQSRRSPTDHESSVGLRRLIRQRLLFCTSRRETRYRSTGGVPRLCLKATCVAGVA
jgi:hypothetical protein